MLANFISLLIDGQTGGAAAGAAGTDAAAGAGAAGGGMSGLIMIVVLIAVFYFFMIRPQQKKAKELRKQREAMQVGDTVVTAGGIHGKIVGVKDTVFVISVSDGVRLKVEKTSVYPSAAEIEQTDK